MPYLVVYFNNEIKSRHLLEATTTTIGRNTDNHVVIDNAGVSGLHAEIIQVGDDNIIFDRGSTNGIYVNGERVTEKKLSFGDEIGIFKHKLRFVAVHAFIDITGLPTTETTITSNTPEDATIEIDVSKLDELLKKNEATNAYLIVSRKNRRRKKITLSKPLVNIGKARAKASDIHIGGWFTPKIAARIVRQSDGYYLVPIKRACTCYQGEFIKTRVKLKQGDTIEIRGTKLCFYNNT